MRRRGMLRIVLALFQFACTIHVTCTKDDREKSKAFNCQLLFVLEAHRTGFLGKRKGPSGHVPVLCSPKLLPISRR